MIKNSRFCLLYCFISILAFISVPGIFAESQSNIDIETSMDWTSGVLTIKASMPLEPGMSPDSHPRALKEMELGLPALITDRLFDITWNNRGTLGDLAEHDYSVRAGIEEMAESAAREWSSLSSDFSRVEALYTLNMNEALSGFGDYASFAEEDVPPGWRALPEDGWTGVVIYVPDSLHLRGTKQSVKGVKALHARILDDDLGVLFEPDSEDYCILTYLPLSRMEEAEKFAGRRPYRTMARALYGDCPCDVILSREDSINLLASPSGREALSDGRVVILMGE